MAVLLTEIPWSLHWQHWECHLVVEGGQRMGLGVWPSRPAQLPRSPISRSWWSEAGAWWSRHWRGSPDSHGAEVSGPNGLPWLLYQSQGRQTMLRRQPQLWFPGPGCSVLSRPIGWSSVPSTMLAGAHLPKKGTVHLEDGQFLGLNSFPCSLPPSLLPMGRNLHLKSMSSLHPLWLSATASQSYQRFPVHLDAKHRGSLRIREISGRTSLSTTNLLGWIIPCGWGCPVHCRVFSAIPLPRRCHELWQPNTSPAIIKCSLGGKIAPSWETAREAWALIMVLLLTVT